MIGYSAKKLNRLILFVWGGGLVVLVAVDYCVRIITGHYYVLGLGEPLWYGVQILLTLISLFLLYLSIKNLTFKNACFKVILSILLGMFFYLVVIWFYVIGTGIDSF